MALVVMVPGITRQKLAPVQWGSTPFFPCFHTFGSSPVLLMMLILLLSSIFVFTFSKRKTILVKDTSEDEISKCRPTMQLEMEASKDLNADKDTVTSFKSTDHSECCLVDEHQVESTELTSDSESSDSILASENLEFSWMCSSNIGQIDTISESSCSDEDENNLIEISLPKKNSVNTNEESKQKLQSSQVDCFPESIFRQKGFVELLEEIEEATEEENLIEIDLSMGFIK
ncbi:hypothetical protein K2173_023777 [Erythroxylum novogranatense]|uniref:Uncharacterized protein n=1 Tax=Erythroxylum novogranatense TaxID=1862640 RepID=A0AAV8TKG2_9ROSI|nr:hypothetical protein K2173_023777 [Erythroxylum novogranatense]